MNPGIETQRPVFDIDRVPESKLKDRLLQFIEDGDGIRDGQRLDAAERDLRSSIQRYLKWCPFPDMVLRILNQECDGWHKKQEEEQVTEE